MIGRVSAARAAGIDRQVASLVAYAVAPRQQRRARSFSSAVAAEPVSWGKALI